MPVRPGDFSPSEVWIDNREKRELAMRKRFIRGSKKWSEHTRDLPPLAPGSRVLIQNQFGAGKLAKKWDKSGVILQHLGFNKYQVKVDGSGRITDRNRQFLKKFTPVTPVLPGPTPNAAFNPSPQLFNPTPVTNRSQRSQPFDSAPTEPFVNSSPPTPRFIDIPDSPTSPSFVTPPSSPAQAPGIPEASCPTPEPVTLPTNEPETQPQVRRSTRIRNPPKRYNPAEYDLS